MAIGKKAEAQSILDEIKYSGENLDAESIISRTIALTSPNTDPRLHPANPKLAYADRNERFSLARKILFKIAYPKQTEEPKTADPVKNVVLNLEPTDKKSEKWEEADEKTKQFRDNVKRAGFINLDKFHQEYLDHQGLLPEKMQGTEITAALNLYARGAKSTEIAQQADVAQNLIGEERDYLYRTAYFVACFEEANLKAELPDAALIQTANLTPEVKEIETYTGYEVVEPQENQFVFASTMDGSMTPVIPYTPTNDYILNIQDKLKDMAFNAIEKGGKKLIKKELKAVGKKAAKKVGKEVAKQGIKIAAKAGVKLAVKGTVEVASQALNVVPGLGLIVAAVIEVADKIITLAVKLISKLKKWIHENPEVVIGLAVTAIVGGLMFGMIPLALLGIGAILLTGLPIATAVGAVVGTVVGFIVAAFAQIAMFFGTVGAFTLAFIMLVIFTFYMITVGGYVVPYWGNNAYSNFNVNQGNPYIGVGKIADPIANPTPTSVTYTITVTAKRGNLTNLRITDYTCTVNKKNNSHVDCPPDQPPPIPSDVVVGVSSAYSFTYTVNYGSYGNRFNDALIVDTITITADTPTQSGVSSSSSAGVCFGDCPEDCPSGWPVGPENGESQLQVTQGPYAPYSHTVLDGIDITNFDSPSYQSMNGHTIHATHSGLFCAPPSEPDRYGNVVYIVGQCNGHQFASVYAHIMTGSAMLPSGSHVTKGQSIALTDDTGGWNFPHLHYEFSTAGGDGTTCSGFWAQPSGTEPNMTTIYGVSQGCFWNCGVTIP